MRRVRGRSPNLNLILGCQIMLVLSTMNSPEEESVLRSFRIFWTTWKSSWRKSQLLSSWTMRLSTMEQSTASQETSTVFPFPKPD